MSRPTVDRLADGGMVRRWPKGPMTAANQRDAVPDSTELTGPVPFIVLDFRDVTRLEASSSELRQLTDLARLAPLRGTHVVLVASRDAIYGLCRMLELAMADTALTTHVARSADDAVASLQAALPRRDLCDVAAALARVPPE